MGLTATQFFGIPTLADDPKIEEAFFDPLKMPNGTFKRTQPSRFFEIEQRFRSVFQARAATISTVLDVGVSSGITSLELVTFLEGLGCQVTLTATDLFIHAYIVEIAPGLLVLADRNGQPLQYDVAGHPIRPWIRRLDYLTLAVLPRLAASAVIRPIARRKIAAGAGRPVELASQRLARRADIFMVEDDIMVRRADFAGQFDLVRAANILNRGYFAPADLAQAVDNVRRYLRGPGTLFLVTRTTRDGRNDGTLFELNGDGRFQSVERIGNGSEIEDIVVASRP
ncbi:ATP-binding protein [Jiella sp. CQZ9-1]|uniref:ATP-binding protein n=2 Tax=Jiella flava TaxID=2816857 RepID=A0A939FYE9_9HYPH|nr:ATP-binding protein [Jiella flava]